MKKREFIAQIRRQKKTLGLSTADMAERAGVSRQYLYCLLRGDHTPSILVAARVAAAVGMSLRLVPK